MVGNIPHLDSKFKDSGIYIFKNKINNKVYIGSSININKRIREHFILLNQMIRKNKPLFYFYRALNKYKYNDWDIDILEIVDLSNENDSLHYRKTLQEREQYYIDMYRSYDSNFGYNSLRFAYSPKGRCLTEETKKRIGEANKINTKKFAEENGGGYWKGKKRPKETIEKFKKVRANPILQLNKDFEIEKRWLSAKEAQKESNGFFNSSAIGRCCNGERKTHKGFHWIRECDYNDHLLNNEVINL